MVDKIVDLISSKKLDNVFPFLSWLYLASNEFSWLLLIATILTALNLGTVSYVNRIKGDIKNSEDMQKHTKSLSGNLLVIIVALTWYVLYIYTLYVLFSTPSKPDISNWISMIPFVLFWVGLLLLMRNVASVFIDPLGKNTFKKHFKDETEKIKEKLKPAPH